ncbi:MAG: T9SS type A sorting domain-containing protein [Bacteroidota bacterium]|nr:T9SS type A sorting domain-containing protein [Bacteroidota bacterium]
MREIISFSLIIFFFVLFSSINYAQWSAPRPIDSIITTIEPGPLAAVSKQGYLVIVYRQNDKNTSELDLYRSTDHGKTFTRNLSVKPPVPEYDLHKPYGLAYDTNNTLWLLWGWDWYYDATPIGYFLVLSKSTNHGETFTDVLFRRRGLQLDMSRMIIDPYNNIHILRDSVVFGGGGRMIYTRLDNGNTTNQFDFLLPQPQAPYMPREYADFTVSDDSLIHYTLNVIWFEDGSWSEKILYSRSTDYGKSFSNLSPIDTSKVESKPRIIITHNKLLLISYFHYSGLRAVISEDDGNTFSNPFTLGSHQPGWIATFNKDSNYTYILYTHINGTLGTVFNKYLDIRSSPIDTMFFDTLEAGYLALGPRGGKYAILREFIKSVGYKLYTSSRDIPTSIANDWEKIPERFLIQAAPNPFNGSTVLFIENPSSQKVTIEIFNTLGQSVYQNRFKQLEAGRYDIKFDASQLASGLYIAAVKTEKQIKATKLLLLK